MDSRFADRMNELGSISDELLASRWATVEGIASGATREQKARLILIACREPIDRDLDSWFWEPFRSTEPTFPVENGVEMHARLADAAVLSLISGEQDVLTAALARLAMNAGYKPTSQHMRDDAQTCLKEGDPQIPAPPNTSTIWSKASQEALNNAPSDPNVISTQLDPALTAAQSSVTSLQRQLAALIRWATAAQRRLFADQAMLTWILDGQRSDGTPWPNLSSGAVAVDSAFEMSGFVLHAPQPRHERALLQLLSVSSKTDTILRSAPAGSIAPRESCDAALEPLTPILTSIATGTGFPRSKPSELVTRVLWEYSTLNLWRRQ